jgi:hypothetical protein
MRRFPAEFADLLSPKGRALLAGRHAQSGALANPRTRFLALDGVIDPRQARAVSGLLDKALLSELREMAQPIPPETIWEQTQNSAVALPKTLGQRTTHLDNARSAAFRVAKDIGLIGCLRSESYRAFAAALAGRPLKKKYGLQAIAYAAGDYAGPHTDHHPEEPAAARGYLDVHLSFATPAVRDQYLVYARTGHFTEMVEVTQKPGLVTAYRLPFWHYTTPLRAKPKKEVDARRWVLLGTFLFSD